MLSQEKAKTMGGFHGWSVLILSVLLGAGIRPAQAQTDAGHGDIPKDIQTVMNKDMYKGSTWGLRVVDLDSGRALINLQPGHKFFVASVRKVITVGELMNAIGPAHRYNTPVYRQGTVNKSGVLNGDLILVASGDLTMGGRTNPDGSIALGDFDHNEANDLGNATLTKPDPVAGYRALARQVAASGIKEITGDVVIDDRLFKPYEFRKQFELRPIFVNDDVVDVIINPEPQGDFASVQHRPVSQALAVKDEIEMTGKNTEVSIKPALPACIGDPDCSLTLTGNLPVDFVPPLTGRYPLIRTIRITQPSNYARTVFIEELCAAGVKVKAPAVDQNDTELLPAKDSYAANARVAELQGMPYGEDAKFVMKVSYNMGADTSLLLYGLTQGADDMESALAVEQKNLKENYGISPADYSFVDGSGGDDTTATTGMVTHFLTEMSQRANFPQYHATFPILGVDGSLATVTDFESDRTLAAAKGQVYAKTGTYVGLAGDSLELKCQAFGGYLTTRSGKKLAYQLVVNGVPLTDPEDITPEIIKVFQDEGTISAILWRDF
jgi:D-alanyl-D-alanine carboxypeptidase